MRTVTRAVLTETAYMAGSLSRAEAAELVEETIETMAAALVAGETVKVSNFGTFATRRKPARMGRNPKRPEEEVLITPRRVATFKASLELKKAVRTGLEPIPAAGENWFAKARLKVPG